VRSLFCATLVALVATAVAAPAAWSTFPGLNGRLAYEARSGATLNIFTIQPLAVRPEDHTRLTSSGAIDRDAAWSSDGDQIAFMSQRDGNAEIYRMNADGTGQRRLTTDPAFDADPTFSPDGTQLAFTSTRDGNPEIYVMAVDGSGQRRLTFDPATDLEADWSPDGTRIAFESDRDGNMEIYAMNPDGGAVTRLTFNPEVDVDPSWHPDGTRIAFVSGAGGGLEIFNLRPGTAGRTQLTRGASDAHFPAWSPDGEQIAFTRSEETRVMKADARGIGEVAANGADAAWGSLPPPPPVPTLAKTMNVEPPTTGTVFVRVDGAAAAAPLVDPHEIPVGSVIDTREGELKIEAAAPNGRSTSSVTVSEGRATLSQTDGGVTVLRLPRDNCCGVRRNTLRTRTRARTPALSAALSADSARRKRKKGSRVNSPDHSKAISGGTDWTTIRTRRGTTTRVHSGVVEVTDLTKPAGCARSPRVRCKRVLVGRGTEQGPEYTAGQRR
jgi:dipeptidyl aminopeptidase/acylaminoacyl peptidase